MGAVGGTGEDEGGDEEAGYGFHEYVEDGVKEGSEGAEVEGVVGDLEAEGEVEVGGVGCHHEGGEHDGWDEDHVDGDVDGVVVVGAVKGKLLF